MSGEVSLSGPGRLTLVVVLDVRADGVEAFQRYEAAVLPLLDRHGGRLERRLRTADERVEVHLLSFAARTGYDAYLVDPERRELGAALGDDVVTARLLEVRDVEPPAPGPA